jgi:hypothetical protein
LQRFLDARQIDKQQSGLPVGPAVVGLPEVNQRRATFAVQRPSHTASRGLLLLTLGDLTAETALARGVRDQLQTQEGSSLSACVYLRCHGSHHRVDLGNPVADFFPLQGAGVGILPRIAKRDGIRSKSTEGRQDRAKAVGVDGNPSFSMSTCGLS